MMDTATEVFHRQMHVYRTRLAPTWANLQDALQDTQSLILGMIAKDLQAEATTMDRWADDGGPAIERQALLPQEVDWIVEAVTKAKPFDCQRCRERGFIVSGPHSHQCSKCDRDAVYGWYTTPLCEHHFRRAGNASAEATLSGGDDA